MRTKHVFDKDQVAHLWANQSQDSARVAHDNFYFQGDTIYSYGNHFPIAKHVTNKKGQKAVLFTTADYSSTTAKHKAAVRSACRHLNVFNVFEICERDHQEQFDEYAERVAVLADKASRARSNKEWLVNQAVELVEEANRFAEFFGLRKRLKTGLDTEALIAEGKKHVALRAARRSKAQKAATKAREERDRLHKIELEGRYNEWKNGVEVYDRFDNFPVALRVRQLEGKEPELETSLRATVPLNHAKRVFALVKKCKDTATPYKRNGHTIHVGSFAIDEIDTEGNVKAGCHDIEWKEIARFAATQEWND